jgi:putative pyruvate formate lyase activating enzyme
MQKNAGIIRRRAVEARRSLASCEICPRRCKANRLEDGRGTCGVGSRAIIASAHAHFGEEPPLVGSHGSGTIFFVGCNLHCVFCQNFDISHSTMGRELTPPELADVMLDLQDARCHNINLVTPTHVVPQILEALAIAVEDGLAIPVVYNTSAYDRVETLRLLDGVVDIYMPDFKFWDPDAAERYVSAADYPEVARRAIVEMHRQVGDLRVDGRGVAVRGLLVRHLVMPNEVAGTPEILRFIARQISPRTAVNVMGQYRPCGDAPRFEPIARPITYAEHESAVEAAREAGLAATF